MKPTQDNEKAVEPKQTVKRTEPLQIVLDEEISEMEIFAHGQEEPSNSKSSNAKMAVNEEALRVVKAMPKWVPGMQRGNPVRVQYNLPVKFSLE